MLTHISPASDSCGWVKAYPSVRLAPAAKPTQVSETEQMRVLIEPNAIINSMLLCNNKSGNV